jgi:hypothetical protein
MTNVYCDLLPPFESLPPDIQELLGDHNGYDFFRVMPLVRAMDKPGGLTRKGFEYNVDLRRITRKMVGAVPEEERRQAWSYTRHLIRNFHRLCKDHIGEQAYDEWEVGATAQN